MVRVSKSCKHGGAIDNGVYCTYIDWCETSAGCSRGHVTSASLTNKVRRCQDLPLLEEEEGGDVEDLSFSRGSLSSEDTGAAELLPEAERERQGER